MYSTRYKRYVLAILLLIYIFNFMDRQLLAILMEPIKQDLGLSDTQLGLLSGIAFAAFYTTLGIPIASLADRSSRINIISLSVVIWSALTAACGLVSTFLQLFLVRLGVGVGEAGCTPPAHSLISDYFTPAERPQAMSVYMLGIPIGIMLGLLIGGYVNQYFGWRVTFMLVGLPGIAVAILLKMTVKEPQRHRPVGEETQHHPSIKDALGRLYRNITFRHVVIGHSLVAWVGYGVTQWYATYIIRRFDMPTGELGLWLALTYGGAMAAGIYLGGYLTAKKGTSNPVFQTRLCSLGLLAAFPFYVITLYMGSGLGVILMLIPAVFFTNLCISPTYALFQTLAQPTMRAMSTAVALLVINLVGMGLGPLMVGALSDVLTLSLGSTEGLRVAMLSGLVALIWSAWHYWRAGNTITQDLRAVGAVDEITADEPVLDQNATTQEDNNRYNPVDARS